MVHHFLAPEMRMKNVAVFKPTEMSTLYNQHHLPFRAVDDKVAKKSGGAECLATEAESGPGMLIDLENNFDISYITLHGQETLVKLSLNAKRGWILKCMPFTLHIF